MMMKEQDQGLEELGSAVDRVGRMADAMNQELNLQNRCVAWLALAWPGFCLCFCGWVAGMSHRPPTRLHRMLGELEVEVENTNEQMNFVMGKLSKLLKTKDKGQLMLIIILTVILVVLILITIYV